MCAAKRYRHGYDAPTFGWWAYAYADNGSVIIAREGSE